MKGTDLVKNPSMPLIACFALLAGACATAGGSEAPAAPQEPYQPRGEITFAATGLGRSASFGMDRVVGPRVNLSRRSDGSWAGQLWDAPVDVSVYPERVVGVNLTIAKQQTPNGTIYTGQYQGKMVRFEVLDDKMLIRTPNCSYTLPSSGPGQYGPQGVVKLTGEAAANQPWPQFALALMGTF